MVDELKSPQQLIFDELFRLSLSLGFNTYDFVPATNAPLPYVHIGEQFSQDVENKTTITGHVQQTINIYANYKERYVVSGAINKLRSELRRLKKAGPYSVTISKMDDQIIQDNSTATHLQRGILEIDFKFN